MGVSELCASRSARRSILGFDYHFSNLAKGIIDSRNLIFYGSVVALALHFAVFAWNSEADGMRGVRRFTLLGLSLGLVAIIIFFG